MNPDQNPLASRADRLLQLAERLDHASESLKSQAQVPDPSLELSETEQRELARIQGALEFIHQVCVPRDSKTPHPASQQATPTQSEFSTPSMGLRPSEDDSVPIREVGRFKIIRLLGQGGFAKVFLANDPHLNRKVALKLLRNSLFFSDDVISRFQREARAAAVLNHPNIVPVFESGTIDGQPFIASAFCDGTTLEVWKKQNSTVQPEVAAAIVADLADALEHAHQRGIIHRDLKPANILIIPHDSPTESDVNNRGALPGQLRITDFGLAKVIGHVDQLETAEGAIVGTPAYMSPEQASGKQQLESASDIYSLGVVLYELLTSQLPILGETNIETLLAIKTKEPKSLRSIRSDVPRDLEAICLKCLSKSADQRYATAHDLATDLRRWMQGEPIVARRSTSWERLGKWIRRNPILASAFAGLSLATMLAITQWANASYEYRRAEDNLKLANQQAARAQQHLELSQEVIDNMVVQVADDAKLPPPLRRSVAEKASRFQDKLLDDAPEDVKVAIKAVRAHNRLGRLLFDLSEFEAALETADAAIKIGSRFPENDEASGVTAYSKQMKTGILIALKRTDESQKVMEDAQKTTKNKMQRAANHFGLGMAKLDKDQQIEAIKEFDLSLQLTEDMEGGYVKFPRGRALCFAGRAELQLGNYDKAIMRTKKAYALFQSLKGSGHGGNVILEELGRCELQLAEIQVRKVSDPIADSTELDQAVVTETVEYLDRAIASLAKLYQIRPNVIRFVGQQAYCMELKCQFAKQLKNVEMLEDCINEYAALLEKNQEENRLRDEIRLSYLQSHQRLVELQQNEGLAVAALKSAKEWKRLASDFLESSNDDRFKEYVTQAEELIESMSN